MRPPLPGRTPLQGPASRRVEGETPLSLSDMQAQRVIEYIPFPPALVGKYQSYTQADISQLRATGYRDAFLNVDEGVGRYVDMLLSTL